MISIVSFFTIGLALTGSSIASPFKRSPTLLVSLSSAPSINSVDEISLVATVENPTDQEIKVLKYGTVLENELPSSSFTVTRGNEIIPFTGIKFQRDMSNLPETDFVVIPAGQTVNVTHTNIAPLYDFREAGVGTFTFTPNDIFQVIPPNGAPSDALTVTAEVPSVEIFVASDVAKRKLSMEKRETASCSVAANAEFISSAIMEAKGLASWAASYIKVQGTNDPLYKAYFGKTGSNKPLQVFQSIRSQDTAHTLDCSDPERQCGGNVIAYTVLPGGNMHYCSIFFNEVHPQQLCSTTTVNTRNLRGGTVLHEYTHSRFGTEDYGYGCPYDQSLASSDPNKAINNADNYNCFAAEVYHKSFC